MQRTRLSTLVTVTGDRLTAFFGNPWRRLSLQAISLLLGVFVGQAVATISGQTGQWDVPSAGILVIFTELASVIAYRRRSPRDGAPIFREALNLLKIGIIYSLFLEAFKLGS
jgi:hypothetical protein